MHIEAWMIPSWPKREWYLPMSEEQWPQFVHLGTRVHGEDELGRTCGDTVWAADEQCGQIVVGWEWTELGKGVVVLRDPNTIHCNSSLPFDERDRPLNRLTHTLAWRPVVCATLKALRQVPEGRARIHPYSRINGGGRASQAGLLAAA